MRKPFGAVLVAAVLAVAAPCAFAYPAPGLVAGDTLTHDPSMLVREGGAPRYVVYQTHNQTLVSNDRIAFSAGPPIFPVKPEWWAAYNGGNQMWAPDASFHDGKYWLYYSVTDGTGSRHSAIGVATSPSGLPGTWTDHGKVLSSETSDTFNAIDPNLHVDAEGKWWLVWGSFWDGIYITPLNRTTGKATTTPATKTNIARRAPGGTTAVEGPALYRHGGYYYLFASFDYCCTTAPNYSVRVGRSTSPTGPYVDAAGVSMLQGGGTVVLRNHTHVRGPGGQSVVRDSANGGRDVMVYHYHDARIAGANAEVSRLVAFLGINLMAWDANGWPYLY